jgi:hypothetical protein
MDGWAQMDDGLEEGLEIRQDSRGRIMEVQAMRIEELEGVIASLSAELEVDRILSRQCLDKNLSLSVSLSLRTELEVDTLSFSSSLWNS